MSISASMVKELRDKTGAGMMDCKQALTECSDLEKAVDWLRQKGLAKAAKRSGRVTSEGFIGSKVEQDGKVSALVELLCETDFVAKSDRFQEFAQTLADQVARTNPPAGGLLDQPYIKDGKLKVQDTLNEIVASIGENISIGRYERFQVSQGCVGCYIHNTGKIAVLVEVLCAGEATAKAEAFQDLAKNIAMQIAASNPLAVNVENLDPVLVEREREVYRQKAREEGKAEAVIEKIVEGGIKKYFKDVILLEQPYIRDDKQSVRDLLGQVSSSLGEAVNIGRFVRMQVGAE